MINRLLSWLKIKLHRCRWEYSFKHSRTERRSFRCCIICERIELLERNKWMPIKKI